MNVVRKSAGYTLVELMIAMSIALFMMLGLTSLIMTGKLSYTAQDQRAHVQETGRYVVEVIARSVRQAGHEDWGHPVMPVLMNVTTTPNVFGVDARTVSRSGAGLDAQTSGVVNGSDVLALRFVGDDAEGREGAILNCAGFTVAAPAAEELDEGRGWSIFFVARDAGGEPELRCKYRSKTGWSADAIARGVESFQVLYGVDTDGSGRATTFMHASAVEELGAEHWKRVRAVRIAILVSSAGKARDDALRMEYDLFGSDYSAQSANADVGTRIVESSLPAASRNRIRNVFTQTIQLRNDAAGSSI